MNSQEQKKLEQKVRAKLQEKILPRDSIILAFSGGSDSVFLFEMLKKIDIKHLILGHLNHSLRGKASDDDEKFTILQGKNNPKMTVITKKMDIAKLAEKEKRGLEETGRKYRYKFFNELAKKHKASFVLTAHHADDNLETVLLNFIRGASLKGLCGMEEVNGNIFRAILSVSKAEILDYLKSKKIRFRSDKSNKDLVYRRNYLRHKIIPELTKINPSLTQTLAQNSKNMRNIVDFLEKEAQTWLKKNSEQKTDKNTISFKRQTFLTRPPAIQQQIILEIHRLLTGNTQNIETVHIEEVLKIIHQNIGNKQKKLGQTTITLKNNLITCGKLSYNGRTIL